MKVTYNWLKQYVDFDWSPDEMVERLTMLGLEVEGVQKLGGEFEGIVVAQVITRDKHPNADKLSVCRVNDGKGERQIVCGAQNFQAGDKVPLILPGASLPMKPGDKEPFTIKVGKIRSVESHGMMCAPQELGLPDEVDGLLILRADATVGQPFAEYLGRAGSDVVYDLETTPNRPDWNSVIGIAREISALTGNSLKLPNISLPQQASSDKAEDLVAVRIEDAELNPRYTARVVKGVKVGPSPDWLRSTLEKIGLRSISNVVDVTNYVMLEIGQPLHAFDYHLIAKGTDGKPTIVVRRATEGEKFKTLDDAERTLTTENLLIADEQKGIALAGVMGGLNTEINDQTVDVLIESAYFKPQNIRATSKKLDLRTDSSYRFERGGDIGICDWASLRAAQLILQTAGGQLAEGVVDVCPQAVEPKDITLRHTQVRTVVGIDIPVEQQIGYLMNLGLEMETAPGIAPSTGVRMPHSSTFRIPTYRVDLKREIDLIEEIVRMYGVDKIPSTPPRGANGSHPYDAVHDQLAEARRILVGLGLNEAQGQTLIADSAAKLVTVGDSLVALSNPLSSDMNVLRPSLLPGLLDSMRHNISHKNNDVAVFEVGRVFVQNGATTKEERRVAIALTGKRYAQFWSGFLSKVELSKDQSVVEAFRQDYREVKFDAYDLKGVLESFLEAFGLKGLTFTRREGATSLFIESATIQLGKLPLGELGQVIPTLAKKYDLRDAVFVAELNLDQLLARRNTARSFKSLPQFPSSRRDVAMLVPEATTHDAVLMVVRQAKPANLESVELFDIFRGKNVPEGQKSVAYAFTYRSGDKTLTDADVNGAHEGLLKQFTAKLNAVMR